MDHNQLDMFTLFLQADIFVKFVMLLLLAASLWSWSIIFQKTRIMLLYKSRSALFARKFWNKHTVVEDIYNEYQSPSAPYCPTSDMFRVGYAEYKRLIDQNNQKNEEILENVERSMVSNMNKDIEHMEKSLIILSSISSAAPFVGLLGTVWGIMNSFSAIAASQQTNLAVVAPGIAEALFATALGLIAAIPANIAYNRFTNDIHHYLSRLENFRHDFIILISRALPPN